MKFKIYAYEANQFWEVFILRGHDSFLLISCLKRILNVITVFILKQQL